MIRVTQVLAASDTDVLAGTQLDQIPEAGEFAIIGASTQNDGTLNVSLGQALLIQAQALPLRVSGVPDLSDDPVMSLRAGPGARPVIAYVEVTAASVFLIIEFTGDSERR